MISPKLSIIIPTWNTAAITAQCVASLQSDRHSRYWEIIVVDNASSDNTHTVFQKRSDLVYLRLSRNFGYAYACNAGARFAKADNFLFLNSDMELVSHLENMRRFLALRPSIGLVAPRLLNTDSSPQGSVFPPQNITNAFKEFWLGKTSFSKYNPLVVKPTPVWAVSGGAVLISRRVFNKLHGWNQNYHMYFEDLDLCRRLRSSNLQIIYYPRCRFIHRHGASGSALADSQNQWRRLISGSKQYHGTLYHYLLSLTIWSGQKLSALRRF